MPSSLGSFQTLAMMDFDPLLFSLSFAWLLSVSFSLSLYLAKRSRKISLSHYYFSSSLTRDKSLSLSYYPCGATYLLFPFLPSQLLSLPRGTLFKSLSVRAVWFLIIKLGTVPQTQEPNKAQLMNQL